MLTQLEGTGKERNSSLHDSIPLLRKTLILLSKSSDCALTSEQQGSPPGPQGCVSLAWPQDPHSPTLCPSCCSILQTRVPATSSLSTGRKSLTGFLSTA